MKTLNPHFVSKNNNFDLIRSEHPVYMYQKTTLTGKHMCYEVFITSVAKAGTAGRGGHIEEEDREKSPGNSAFGTTAFCEILEDRAEKRFNDLLRKVKNKESEFNHSDDSVTLTNHSDDGDDDDIETPIESTDMNAIIPEKRGRKKKFDTSLVVFPDGKFIMKDLLAINPTFNQPILYNYIQSLIDLNKIKNEGTVKSNTRGKPAVIYSKINQ